MFGNLYVVRILYFTTTILEARKLQHAMLLLTVRAEFIINVFFSQGFLPETHFHRLLTEHSEIPKKTKRRHHHHHHHHHHHTPEPIPEDPILDGVEEETLVSDGAYMMDEEDLETSHHFLTSPDFDVKIGGGDSLSQGDYDSSDQEALLDDVIIAQKDTDSSSSSED